MSDKSFPTFTYKGKTYEVVDPKISIPRLGMRTAREVAADEEAQAILVDKDKGGDSIRLVKKAKTAPPEDEADKAAKAAAAAEKKVAKEAEAAAKKAAKNTPPA